jgi:hypothetical protein
VRHRPRPYALAFDRLRVERILEAEGLEGRAYIEKTVEVAQDIPPAPEATLNRILLEGLDAAMKGLETGLRSDRWTSFELRARRLEHFPGTRPKGREGTERYRGGDPRRGTPDGRGGI